MRSYPENGKIYRQLTASATCFAWYWWREGRNIHTVYSLTVDRKTILSEPISSLVFVLFKTDKWTNKQNTSEIWINCFLSKRQQFNCLLLMHTPFSPSCSFASEEFIFLYSLTEFVISHQICTEICQPRNAWKQFNSNGLKEGGKKKLKSNMFFLYVLIKESLGSLFVMCQSFYAGKGVIYNNYHEGLLAPLLFLKKILLEKVRRVVL